MSHRFFYIQAILIFLFLNTAAQKKWDSGGHDDQWNNAQNWSDDAVPRENDAVVLDNTYVHDRYNVQLPPGNVAVTVRSINISPSAGDTIELVLPESNTLVPGLVINGPGYGLQINDGGIFRNASGASSGTPVSVSDSIRINNGGRYIHNTVRAHAANMQVLSAAPGTEQGIVEFDVPALSSTISLSGRTYGKLILKADAVAGGALKYTAAGTNRVSVRSDLEIGPGVACGLNFSDTIVVGGNFLEAGILDMGNTARNVVLLVKGDVIQPPGGIITETGTGSQELLLNGSALQKINMQGSIHDTVAVTLNSSGEDLLLSPLVLPYKLSLLKGRLTTSPTTLLVLGPWCTIQADTLAGSSFINGPVKKMGLVNNDFVFPVGENGQMRWMELKNVTGDFTVSYSRSDPYMLGSSIGEGLDHVSHLEYWTVTGAPAGDLTAKLSFRDPASGGVTSLTDLRVAKLIGKKWENAGNAAVNGSAGGDGWVSSIAAGGFSADNYFALASVIGQENPLPFSGIVLAEEWTGNAIHFSWKADPAAGLYRFELQQSSDNNEFTTIYEQLALPATSRYYYDYKILSEEPVTFRIKAANTEGTGIYYSNIIPVRKGTINNYYITGASITGTILPVSISVPADCIMSMFICNSSGIPVKRSIVHLLKGSTELSFGLSLLPAGWYYLFGSKMGAQTNVFRFFKS